MPHVSYYRRTVVSPSDARELLKQLHAAAAKNLGVDDENTLRLKSASTEQVDEMEVFERVKLFVKDEDDIPNVERLPGFVRFGHHGYNNIYELIQMRKAAGRNDWY